MTDPQASRQPRWVGSGSGSGRDAPGQPSPPRLSRLRGIRLPIPGPIGTDRDQAVPPHVKADALRTVLERHVTGTDGICFCGERAGEFTGRCSIGRKVAKQLTALGFQGYEVPAPPLWRGAPLDGD